MLRLKSILSAFVILLLLAPEARGAGKAPPRSESAKEPVLDGKRVIAFEAVENTRIEMPDGSFRDFGADFQARLSTLLQETGRFILADPRQEEMAFGMTADPSSRSIPEFRWNGSYVPAATLRVKVEAMSFTTGARGDRMDYGFDDRLRTPYNDGTGSKLNEFPLKQVVFEPNWFDRTFDGKGSEPFDSRAGLDLGQGFALDFLLAWLKFKYALYRAEIHLRLEIDAPLAGRQEFRKVQVKGKGFFWDVAGGYQGYSGAIRIARTDAMLQAFLRSIDGSFQAIERSVEALPLTARLDHRVIEKEQSPLGKGQSLYLLGTGKNAEVRAGVLFALVNHPEVVLRVARAVSDGAVAELVSGDPAFATDGELLVQVSQTSPGSALRTLAFHSDESSKNDGASQQPESNRPVFMRAISEAGTPAAVESIELPDQNLPKAKFNRGDLPEESQWSAFWQGAVNAAILPYRIWRYYQYDRSLKNAPDEIDPASDAPARFPEPREGAAPVVAVVDTGVDYNHPAIHRSLWINPWPWKDARGAVDRYGWDFISGDSRPYDDAYHGTQLASIVLRHEPQARIMALKVFNPWGVTSSAALFGAITYAVDHGAKVILCGWATRKYSDALEQAVAYARARGAVIVAAAGDRGENLAEMPSYPAALSKVYDNVITVAAVNDQDELVQVWRRFSNFGPEHVAIAARAQDVRVAEPRGRWTRDTSSGIAAAKVAAALATVELDAKDESHAERLRRLKEKAERVRGLEEQVADGLVLRDSEAD